MMQLISRCRLIFIGLLLFSHQSSHATYRGSHAYNQAKAFNVQVNTATGTLSLTYPLIEAQGVRMPLKIHLTYTFNALGKFGLPTGWQLDLDHITQHTAELGGMQWLIDNLWHDETGFASGLKYFNQHGTRFLDNGQSLPVPGYPNLNYRYVSEHKDGSRQFFSYQGLLILQVDRFDNHVQFSYEEPVTNLESARLACIKDNYGNVYRFSYEPDTLIIHGPDHRIQRIYFNSKGVTKIENPLKQSYKITYANQFGRSLIRTLQTPEGLITELSYGGIFYKDDHSKRQMPVVKHFKQFDQASLKNHHEAYYTFNKGNNYTGYPNYSLSSTGDSLMDSNDQSYKYSVKVTHINGEQQRQQVYEYNYLHLPVEVRTLRDDGQPYLLTTYEYAISPFKYSRSTNYDKPTVVTRHVWNGKAYIPSDKTTTTYDHYGNNLSETRSVYNRQQQHWQVIDASFSRYFTKHFSLLAEHTRIDLLGGRAICKRYTLAPNGKTHSQQRLIWKPPLGNWQDWQQTDLIHDDKGRQRSTTLSWLIKTQPGIQSLSNHTRYHFDPNTGELTITNVSDQGREHTMVVDTRNDRHLKTITPKGEVTTYTYDALNRPLTHTDPAGYITHSSYETFSTDGQNTITVQSPLGDTRRTIHDASKRPIHHQDLHNGKWRTLLSQSYDAFGTIESKTNILGLTTTFAYDEHGRRTKTTDPWGNEHRIDYNDAAMTTTTRINGRLHMMVSKVPWERKQITRNYPVTNNPYDQAIEFVENTVVQDAHKKTISTTNVLVNLHTQKKRKMVTKRLRYDAQDNLITSDTHTWDGLHGHKTRQYDLLNHLYTWHKTLKTPEHISRHSGYRYLYDGDGLLTQIESPKTDDGTRFYLKHRYDKNGQEIEKVLQSGHRIQYQYDNRGLVTQQAWSRNDKRYDINRQYDADGRLVKLSDSDGQTILYRYTPNGYLLQMRYPDNHSISYTLDNFDRIITQKDANQNEHHFSYKPEDKGLLSSITANNNRIDFHYGEDDNGRHGKLIKRTTNAKATGATQTRFRYGVFGQIVESASSNAKMEYSVSYNYTPRGELFKQVQKLTRKSQTPAQQYSTEYRYDGMQRLSVEVHTDHAASFQKRYRYDGNNNLLTEEDQSNCSPSQRRQYSYNNLDQLVSLKVGEVIKAVVHDSNGYLIQDHKKTQYKYDDAGFLLQVQPQKQPAIHYKYWPSGLLSYSSSGDSQSHFYQKYDKNMQTIVKDGQWRSLVRHGNSIVGRQTDQSFDQFFKVNESTGAILQKNKDETQLRLHRYDAYGKPLQRSPVDETFFTWNQQWTDPETGLTYLRHRFHHPEIRRFITRDNVHVDNRYVYAHGDPVNYIDPTGQSAVSRYAGGGVAVGIGLLGLLLAIPSMGASFGVTATASTSASGAFFAGAGVVAGTLSIGSQAALDTDNKTTATALTLANHVFNILALGDFAVAIAPKVARQVAELISSIIHSGESIASETSLVSEGVLGAAASQNSAGGSLVEAGSATPISPGMNEGLGTLNSNALSETNGEDIRGYIYFPVQNEETRTYIEELSKNINTEFKDFSINQKKWLYAFSGKLLHAEEVNRRTIVQLLHELQTNDIFTSSTLARVANQRKAFNFTETVNKQIMLGIAQYIWRDKMFQGR